MTHTFQVTGMTCEACEYKIQHLFSGVEGVKSVTVDRTNNAATVEMDKHIPLSNFQEVIKPYSKYSVTEKTVTPTFIEEEAPKTWFETYRPLLLIFSFITGVSIIKAFHSDIFEITHFSWMHFMNNFMAGFFIVFSFFKFLNLKAFAESYAMYDLLAMKIPTYGFIYPFIELGLGLAYLTSFQPQLTNWATVIIMGFSSIGVIQSVVDKRKIRCACLGTVFNLPMSTVTIIEDLLMVGMAILMLII
ncbi:MauE/DoxX family redox-associated membrane protein [Emticicia sp. W12TSBA100-4]|uniref:heavy-metal-associated domain-containing protein n=1 Tax=Emticicia sp. W12TSBA100-4 TaxID=3160965 RepID=UPI0033066EFA